MHACTIVARNYLPYARVLAESYRANHPLDRFVVLLIDDPSCAEELPGRDFELLRLQEVIRDAMERHRMAAIYDVMELATAVKPFLLEYLTAESGEAWVYLDPDIKVYAEFDSLRSLLEPSGIVLTPHTTVPMRRDGLKPNEHDILASGVFNLGFIAVTPDAAPFLDWWKQRLRRDALVDHANMLFTDQRWVDFANGYWELHILRDEGYNVAYWNVDNRPISKASEGVWKAGAAPLRFYHFSGFDPRAPWRLTKHFGDRPRVLLSEHPQLRELCEEYADSLQRHGFPYEAPYGYARLPDGTPLSQRLRRLYRAFLGAWESGQEGFEEPPDPFDDTPAFLAWLREPWPGRPWSDVGRFLYAVYDDRPDVRATYWDGKPSSSRAFVNWCLTSGIEEESIPLHALPAPEVEDLVSAPPPHPIEKGGINVAGYFRAELGIGEGGRLALRMLLEAGIPHSVTVFSATANRQQDSFDVEMRPVRYDTNLLCINADQTEYFFRHFSDDFSRDHYTIGLWAWELEDFPESLHGAFRYVDEVWAVSSFTQKSIAKVSTKPVVVMPHPIVPPHLPRALGRDYFSLPEGRFLFLFMLDFHSTIERKNPVALVRAFKRAFANGEGPYLLIKTINGHLRPWDLERLRYEARGRGDIEIRDEYLSAEDKGGLLAVADAYVSLHRSEGFGLALGESMALGKPVIATKYSGNLDFMTDDNSFLVPYELVAVPEGCGPYPSGTKWADPDVDAAADIMLRLARDPALGAEVGRQAQEHVSRRHSLSVTAKLLRGRFDAIHSGKMTGYSAHYDSVEAR